jgi:hypothetical protein
MAEPQTLPATPTTEQPVNTPAPVENSIENYSIDTNPNRAEPLNPKTEYMVMDKKTGNTIAVPFSMGDKQRDAMIQGSIYDNPQNFKDGVYEKLWKPMIESGGANANVFQNPSFVSEAMGKGAMQGGTASIYRPSAEELQLYDKFAHAPELIGQFGGFGVTALGGGVIAKGILKAAMTIPAVAGPLADIFTSNIAKLGLEGAAKVGQVATASTVGGSTMGIYDAISNTQNQLKDNEERVKNGQDPIPLDWGKIGAHAAGQGALFALIGGIGAQIARPLIGMSGIEATSQVAKELAVTGGSMWAIAKAQGANNDDAGLMAFAAVALHSVSLPGSIADRTNAIKQMKYAMADHVQLSNDNIDPSAAYEIGKGKVNEEIEKELSKTVDQSEAYKKSILNEAGGLKYPNAQPVGTSGIDLGPENIAPKEPVIRKNAEQYSDDDISDIKKMMNWERDQQDGGSEITESQVKSKFRDEGAVATFTPSGHSQAMQDIGPQEAFRLMDKASSGEKLMQGGRYKEQDKMQKLLDDYRANVKPHIDDQDFRIASNQEALGSMMKNLAVHIINPDEMNWPEEEKPVEEEDEQMKLEEEKEPEEPPISPMTGGVQEDTGKFGEHNTLFTEEEANKAREAFNKKTSGLHSGIDPTAIGDLLKIGGYHFEGGVREFGAWSKKMIDDIGEHVKPYLQDVWDSLQKQAPKMAQQKVEPTEDELSKQKYFPLEKLGIKKIVDTKTGEVDLNRSGKDMRERYLGTMNERTQRVFDLADDIRGLEKDKAQQEGQFINAGFNGDEAKIKEWIDKLDSEIKDEDKEYWETKVKPAAEEALKLSDGAKEGIGLGNQYFKESGLAMKAVGAIRTFLQNYGINRLYEPDSAEKVLKANEFDNPQQSTGHAKQRVFENPLEAVLYGKRFKTMNYPDLIGIHGEEAAAVTTGRQFVQEAVPEKLSAWTDRNKVPAGWSQVGNMERDIPMKDKETGALILDKEGNQDIKHQVLVAPKAIADIMSVITDPDNLRKVDAYQKAQAINNFTKSFNVMIGLFHDRNFVEQKLFSPGGIKALANTFGGQLRSLMEKGDWKNERLLFLKHGGMTGSLSTNIDVLKPDAGTEGQNWLKKVEKMPIIKGATALVEWHRENLFDVMGQYYKVDSFALRRASWDLKNPDATDSERTEAYRGFARASNNDFGGQSWFARGFNRTTMSVARLFSFAPDWLYSAFRTAKTAAIDWKGIAGSQGTEGGAARALLIKQFMYATAATQAANYAINGHFTDKNTKGNEWSVELNKNIHISLYAAGLGELVKLCSDVGESGWATGLGQYLKGKASPVIRFVSTFVSHTNYHNQDITKETGNIGGQIAKVVPEEYRDDVAKQINYVNELASTIAPVPFAVDPGNVGYIADQVKDAMAGKKADIAGSLMLPTVLAKYSAGESPERQQQDIDQEVEKGLAKNDDTAANKYLASGDITQDKIDELQAKADETPVEKSYKHLSVEKIIKKADGNIDSMDADDKDSLKTMLDDKYSRMKASPNEMKRVGDLLSNFYDKHKIQ